jgi:hypothetical protein
MRGDRDPVEEGIAVVVVETTAEHAVLKHPVNGAHRTGYALRLSSPVQGVYAAARPGAHGLPPTVATSVSRYRSWVVLCGLPFGDMNAGGVQREAGLSGEGRTAVNGSRGT